jgi:hypothetical protein
MPIHTISSVLIKSTIEIPAGPDESHHLLHEAKKSWDMPAIARSITEVTRLSVELVKSQTKADASSMSSTVIVAVAGLQSGFVGLGEFREQFVSMILWHSCTRNCKVCLLGGVEQTFPIATCEYGVLTWAVRVDNRKPDRGTIDCMTTKVEMVMEISTDHRRTISPEKKRRRAASRSSGTELVNANTCHASLLRRHSYERRRKAAR